MEDYYYYIYIYIMASSRVGLLLSSWRRFGWVTPTIFRSVDYSDFLIDSGDSVRLLKSDFKLHPKAADVTLSKSCREENRRLTRDEARKKKDYLRRSTRGRLKTNMYYIYIYINVFVCFIGFLFCIKFVLSLYNILILQIFF